MAEGLNLDRAGLWPTRVLWLLLPLAVGFGFRETTEGLPSSSRLAIEIFGWALWFGGLLATFVPSTVALTVSRILAPAIVGFGLAIAAITGGMPVSLLLAIGFGLLVCATVFMPSFGDQMVNGSAYGSERRMALRPPAFALFGPIQLAWLVSFVGLVAAPLLVASQRYVAAAAAGVIGVAFVYGSGKVLHQFARRWIVFVPAGFVIHDPLVVVDAVLFRRTTISALGPALDIRTRSNSQEGKTSPQVPDSDNGETNTINDLDLSGGAPGLALAVSTKEPLPITIRPAGVFSGGSPVDTGGNIKNLQTTTVVFTPTLPGQLLQEARVRGIKIGVTEAAESEPLTPGTDSA